MVAVKSGHTRANSSRISRRLGRATPRLIRLRLRYGSTRSQHHEANRLRRAVYHGVVAMTARRRALWALLAAKLIGGWGVGWDIRWHLTIGRDSFWIAPHVMTYASVVVACAISLGVLVAETWRARDGALSAGTIAIVGLRGTRGFHLAWWGMAIVILAAPVDDLGTVSSGST